jgi:STE24 endopeptidase
MTPAELAVESAHPPLRTHGEAKTYSRIKLTTGIASAVLSFLLLLSLLLTGATVSLAHWSTDRTPGPYTALILYTFVLGMLQSAITLPIGFYSGFILEHRFRLSNQSIGRWAWEHTKGLLVGLPIIVGVILFLFYSLTVFESLWWLPVACGLTFLSVVLARLAPTFILPLFYRLTPLPDGNLRERIGALCSAAGVQLEGLFSFNLSKNTRKANAAFTGIGRSKRILLSDTLLREFTEEEIETVFAHELGHYVHHHIRTGILISIGSTFLGLYVTSLVYEWSVRVGGVSSIADLAALPLLGLWFTLFGSVTSPLGNWISRRHERQADIYAVRASGKTDAFASALRKLSNQNLADPDPHPVVEFLFYSHPAIAKRIALVESIVA